MPASPTPPDTAARPSPQEWAGLAVAALLLGSGTSVLVWLFSEAIDAIHGVAFDTIAPALGPAGGWPVVVTLAAAGLAVALIVRFLRPARLMALGHIIDAVAEDGGRLDHHDASVVVAGAGVGIGLGAPLGTDTPSAMIGAHLGSWLATRLGWPVVFVQALAVAGVGAGISATFLAQLSALFFALEVVLGGWGGAVFVLPTLLAVAAAALTTYRLTGTPDTFSVPPGAVHWDLTLVLYLLAALAAVLAAIAYVRLMPAMKRLWLRVHLPGWLRMVLAGAIVGVVALWLPDVLGTGPSVMKSLFGGATMPLATLLALAVAKTVLTPSVLGSGFVGGVIGPAMLIGSCVGAAVGSVVVPLFPGLGLSVPVFAMVGTTAMLAGSFHAPLFAAMMIFEMVGAYPMLVPLMLAAAIGYGLSRPFQPGSAYTFGFPALGIHLRPGRFRPASSGT
jgi:chloride channel protein, CIC family